MSGFCEKTNTGRCDRRHRGILGALSSDPRILTEFDPVESGLVRFVQSGKTAFVGKAEFEGCQATGSKSRLVTLKIVCDDRPAHPGASMMDGDIAVGSITSGEWVHRVGCSLALGFADTRIVDIGRVLAVDLLEDLMPAEIIASSPFDPNIVPPKS